MGTLLPQHKALIFDSAISLEVADARGYGSAEKKGEIVEKGFPLSQAICPTMMIPIWDVTGKIATYQHRPDNPRIDKKSGKPRKYETMFGRRMALDVHPLVLSKLDDPNEQLIITEGSRKADSAVSKKSLLHRPPWRLELAWDERTRR